MPEQIEHSLIEQLISLISAGNAAASDEKFETARQVKSFTDEMPGGFLIYRADGNEELIYINKALQRIFRCANSADFRQLTGNSFKGVVYHEDLEEAEKSIKQQSANQEATDFVEYRILGRDGVIRWVENCGHLIHTETAGDIFYAFINDATERIQRRNSERAALISSRSENDKKLLSVTEEYDDERKLIRKEHLRRLEVIEGLSVNYDSILYADIDADKVLPYRISVRLVAQFTKQMIMRDYKDFTEDYVRTWVHPDDAQRVASMISPEAVRKKLSGARTYYFNYRCIKDGETQYLQLRYVDLGSGGRASQVVMGFRIIDEEMLQEMRQKKLLEEALNNAKLASITKNTFLSNMSHDMRTPLNAIFGYTELAEKNADNPKNVKSYLNKINAANRQLLDLVEKVLEVSYIESQDFHITESPCNLLSVANEIYDSFLPQAEEKQLKVYLHSDTVEHANVFADEDKVKQILSHIAGNAIKYTDEGGQIDLYMVEQPSSSEEYATFRFIMKDTGIGISENYLPHIFDPFERERDSTHSGVFGSGLGLTIAKHIIDMMGGKIEAESKQGEGSTFTVTLSFRLMDGEVGEERSSKNFTEKLKNKKVLLVEDNEINLEIETEMLEDLELIVEPAENGKIAVDKMAKAKPGEYLFVLTDIQMPVMDGRQAAEAIRKMPDPAIADIPILALSANAFESDKRASIESGIDAHLTKPIDIPALLKALEKTLKKHGIEL